MDTSFQDLIDRFGETYLQRRLRSEIVHLRQTGARAQALPSIANGSWKRRTVEFVLRQSGYYASGYRNYKDLHLVHNQVMLESLPLELDGFRLLQISDLHIDFDASLTPVIQERLRDLSFDLCVITGDFRADTSGSGSSMLDEMRRLRPQLGDSVYAVLGNHDSIEFLPELEAMGIRMLVNENMAIPHGGSDFYLVGVDDPFFYQTHDLVKAARNIPAGATTVLLSHSPQTFEEAERLGYHLMLSGHTHAGQICLPGRIAIQKNAPGPRRMLYGAWRYGRLQGYTTSGAGATTLPIRFFCPPEIVIHTLRSSRKRLSAFFQAS